MSSYEVIKELENNIETLYKSHPPYIQPKNIHSPLGVLLWNKVLDKIKCHICGKWYKFINNSHLVKHDMNQELYREKFGFGKTIALCSRGTSKKFSDSEKNRENLIIARKKLSNSKKWYEKLTHKSISEKNKKCKLIMSSLNSRAACDEQLKKRLEIIGEISNGTPKSNIAKKLDSGLRAIATKRYGSWNKFVSLFGYKSRKNGRSRKYTDELLLGRIRQYFSKEKKLPKFNGHTKIYNISSQTFINRFGSKRRVLAMAGLTK